MPLTPVLSGLGHLPPLKVKCQALGSSDTVLCLPVLVGRGGVIVVSHPANQHQAHPLCAEWPRDSPSVGRLDVVQVAVHGAVEKAHDGGPGWGGSRGSQTSVTTPDDKQRHTKSPANPTGPAVHRLPGEGNEGHSWSNLPRAICTETDSSTKSTTATAAAP